MGEQWQTLCSSAPKSLWMATAAMKLKDACSLQGTLWQTQRIKKQRHHSADKGPSSQSYGFSSSHVPMWELDHKEGWTPKNRLFQTVVLEKTLESPWDSKKIKPVNPKGNQPFPLDRSESITAWVVMCLSKLWEMVKDREAWHAAVHGVKTSRTRLSDWTTIRSYRNGKGLFISQTAFSLLFRPGDHILRTLHWNGITDSMDVGLGKLREWVMNRKAWGAAVHQVTKSRTRLSDWTELNTEKLECLQWKTIRTAKDLETTVQKMRKRNWGEISEGKSCWTSLTREETPLQ